MSSSHDIAYLRKKRRGIRREIARVRWWRQLLGSRRNLTIAALSHATEAQTDLDATWEALAADAPTQGELAAAIWPDHHRPTPASVEDIGTLDNRLGVYEARLSDNLEAITHEMIDAMSQAHTEAPHAT